MTIVTHILVYLTLGYLFYASLLFLFQRRIIYPETKRHSPPAPSSLRKTLWIPTSFGSIESWFYPCPAHQKEATAPVVIFFHGNRELIDEWPELLHPFLNLGISLYLIEFPGYGRSDGPSTQSTIVEASVLAYDTLIQQEHIEPNQVILFGRSLGTGVACALAAQRNSAALMLMSPFTSLRPYARRFLFPRCLLHDSWDNLQVLRQYTHPVLIIHGKYDTIVPYKEGQKLHHIAKNSQLLSLNCGHNECPKDWDLFWEEVTSFLSRTRLLAQDHETLNKKTRSS
jgi:hypothetical protein